MSKAIFYVLQIMNRLALYSNHSFRRDWKLFEKMRLIDKIKKKIILITIIIFGKFGIEIFHLSERINNRKSELFFRRFNKNDNSLISDSNLVKKIISKRIGGKVEDSFIEFLVDAFKIRFDVQKNDDFHSRNQIHIKNMFTNNNLKIQDFYLISKYFSKLGFFIFSNEIVKHVEKNLTENDYFSIYSLFQKIKVMLQYSPMELISYLQKLYLYNHFVNFFQLDVFINKFDNNHSTRKDIIYVLGPLREEKNLFNYHSKKVALIKPNIYETKLLSELSYRRCYLYSYNPIPNLAFAGDVNVNVIDYHSKKNGDLVDKMNYYTQFLLINGYPQHLQRVLIHQLFETPNNYFSLEFVSFYLSDVQYSTTYLYPSKPMSAQNNNEILEFIWWNGWHDLIANFKFCKLLYEKGFLINNSDLVENIIQMDIDKYVNQMEKFYSSHYSEGI